MSQSFNLSKYEFDEEYGKWYVKKTGNFVRNKNTLRKLYETTGRGNVSRQLGTTSPATAKTPTRSTAISQKYGKFFPSQSKARFSEAWAKPLTLKGGSNPSHNFIRVDYHDSATGKTVRDNANRRFGANINAGSGSVLDGKNEWERHLRIARHYLVVQAANFRVLVGQRALKVFQNSFKYRRFYSNGGQQWKDLAPYTIMKRGWRGTGSRILKEYGDLYKSIKERSKGSTTQIYTDIVPANAGHHKKHSICYAGYHNEGKGTYGSKYWNGHKPKPYVKRQFMGHSSHLDPFQDQFMRKMMKMYLFDSVFLIKKV